MESSKLEKITLPNRDGAKLYLIQIEEGSKLYRLICDKEHAYVVDYVCVTLFEDNRTIFSYDPAGGPYLYVDYKIDNTRAIKSIFELDGETVFLIGE